MKIEAHKLFLLLRTVASIAVFTLIILIFRANMAADQAHAMTLKAGVEETQIQAPGIIGINMQIKAGQYPTILQVIEGTPAHASGLVVGDQILAVGSISTLGLSKQQVDMSISDVPGAKVQFLVLRNGQVQTRTVTVTSLSELSQATQARYLTAPY
ncbi:MAG: PDZ domain-containing protein [Vampirovibrionales bacterium]